jgi:hypothetical protein
MAFILTQCSWLLRKDKIRATQKAVGASFELERYFDSLVSAFGSIATIIDCRSASHAKQWMNSRRLIASPQGLGQSVSKPCLGQGGGL